MTSGEVGDDDGLLLDTSLLLFGRLVLAYICRHVLHSTLNPTLRELSTDETLPTTASVINKVDYYSDTDDDMSRPGSPTVSAVELPTLSNPRSGHVLKLHHSTSSHREHMKTGAKSLSRLARILFCACFAEASNLIVVVGLTSAKLLNSSSRHLNFSISLHVALALILVIVPMVQCLLLTFRSSNPVATGRRISLRSRLLVACVPFGLYCFVFSCIPPYATTTGSEGKYSEDWEGDGWISMALGRVIVVGIVALAGLSGFGAVRSAWNFVENIKHGQSTMVTDGDIARAEQSLSRVQQDLAQKTDRPPPAKTWVGRIFPAGQTAEIDGLKAMERQMTRALKVLHKRKNRQKFSQSFLGQLYHVAGYGFALYCAARLLMSLPSIIFSPASDPGVKGNSYGDWISYILVIALNHFPSVTIDVPLWTRTISLILTGALVASSLAQVLRSVGKILRLTSKTAGASFLLLGLGQLFAVYVLSLLIQMRSSLSSDESESLLGTLPDFRTFGRLFDIVFVLAAMSTIIYRYIALKVD